MTTDLHSHYFPLAAADGAAVELGSGQAGHHPLRVGGATYTMDAAVFDLDRQLSDMTAAGLDRRVLMPPPFTLLYELPAAAGATWARRLNEAMAAAAASRPGMTIGFGTVPLQDPAAAVAELEHARSIGLSGLELASSVAGQPLDAPALQPFWEAAADRRMPLLIHPHYVAGADRMQGYHLRNLVGNPLETALAASRLIFGGIMQRCPGLRIILSHGGGALPGIIGRLDHGYAVRTEARSHTNRPPSACLRSFYYDTIVFNPVALRHLVELVGADRVVVGSDYPFDMAEPDPVAFVRAAGLSPADTTAILTGSDHLLGTDPHRGATP